MGLSNVAPNIQRLMNNIFQDLDFVSAYLDDIMIASRTEEDHLHRLALVFARLREAGEVGGLRGLCLRPPTYCSRIQMCILSDRNMFLGYLFSANSKAVDQNKTTALREVPPGSLPPLRSTHSNSVWER
jgi:hypothetical protein